MHDPPAIDHARPTILPGDDPEEARATDVDAKPWLCLAGDATVRADVAPLVLLETVAEVGEP